MLRYILERRPWISVAVSHNVFHTNVDVFQTIAAVSSTSSRHDGTHIIEM